MDRSIESDWRDENSIKVVYHLLPVTPNRDPNLKNEKGETALHRVSRNGLLQGVKYLIANGADPELMDNNDRKAIQTTQNYLLKPRAIFLPGSLT